MSAPRVDEQVAELEAVVQHLAGADRRFEALGEDRIRRLIVRLQRILEPADVAELVESASGLDRLVQLERAERVDRRPGRAAS